MDAHDLIPVDKNPNIEDFSSGDTVRVNVKVVEGERVRTQAYEGVDKTPWQRSGRNFHR